MMYVDPGSGTLLLQLLLSAAFGLAFYFRQAFRWVAGRTLRLLGSRGRLADVSAPVGEEERADAVVTRSSE